MNEPKQATLQKIYVNQGERGPYLKLYLSDIKGNVEKLTLFDQWYFEEGTEHDIRKHEGVPVEYSTTTKQKGDRTYVNVVHIQPEGQIWEKPKKQQGDAPSCEMLAVLGEIKGLLGQILEELQGTHIEAQ